MMEEQLTQALNRFAEGLAMTEAAAADGDMPALMQAADALRLTEMKAAYMMVNILQKLKTDASFREALASWTLGMQRGVDVSQMDDKCKSEIGDFGTAAGLSILLAIWGQAVLDAQ